MWTAKMMIDRIPSVWEYEWNDLVWIEVGTAEWRSIWIEISMEGWRSDWKNVEKGMQRITLTGWNGKPWRMENGGQRWKGIQGHTRKIYEIRAYFRINSDAPKKSKTSPDSFPFLVVMNCLAIRDWGQIKLWPDFGCQSYFRGVRIVWLSKRKGKRLPLGMQKVIRNPIWITQYSLHPLSAWTDCILFPDKARRPFLSFLNRSKSESPASQYRGWSAKSLRKLRFLFQKDKPFSTWSSTQNPLIISNYIDIEGNSTGK